MKPPVVVESILALLEEYGELTAEEIVEETGRDLRTISKCLHRMRTYKKGKQIYVKKYVYESVVGKRYYPRALYALGSKADAVRPRADTRQHKVEIMRRFRKRKAARVNSVFMLGVPEWRRNTNRSETNAEKAGTKA